MWPSNKAILAVLPALIIMVVFFWGGLLWGICQSFGLWRLDGSSQFTGQFYRDLWQEASFRQSLLFTLKYTLWSVGGAALLGFLFLRSLSFLLVQKGNQVVEFIKNLFLMPMLVPYIVSGYLLALVLAPTGWLSRWAASVGLLARWADFPILINDLRGAGIVLAYVWKTAPFIILMCYPLLQRIHRNWYPLAFSYGASHGAFFREIVVPLLMPSFVISLVIIFAFIFAAFEIPYLLGVTHPRSLAVLSYQLFTSGNIGERPYVMAINTIITFAGMAFGTVVYFINKHLWGARLRGWQ